LAIKTSLLYLAAGRCQKLLTIGSKLRHWHICDVFGRQGPLSYTARQLLRGKAGAAGNRDGGPTNLLLTTGDHALLLGPGLKLLANLGSLLGGDVEAGLNLLRGGASDEV